MITNTHVNNKHFEFVFNSYYSTSKVINIKEMNIISTILILTNSDKVFRLICDKCKVDFVDVEQKVCNISIN